VACYHRSLLPVFKPAITTSAVAMRASGRGALKQSLNGDAILNLSLCFD
jgi:hypothetical protein